MNLITHKYSSAMALGAAAVLTTLLLATFFVFEPSVMIAADSDTDTFIVSQTIVGELAFVTTATDVTMSPNLSGLTGGTSNGQTQVAVRANNATGYNMTIQFSSTTAMNLNGGLQYIPNYVPYSSSTIPDYTFLTPTTTSGFAYTVEATTTTDVAQLFLDNGSNTCNTGSSNGVGTCWYNRPTTTTAVTIINRSTPTPSTGATTTIKFRIGVDANPNPVLTSGIYTATATLTATEN